MEEENKVYYLPSFFGEIKIGKVRLGLIWSGQAVSRSIRQSVGWSGT